uniref:Uncharacterized protein n=1 Tax=Anguilla anguilla TaxID=7936 RepID=A0A0E9PUY3_ANGAN
MQHLHQNTVLYFSDVTALFSTENRKSQVFI